MKSSVLALVGAGAAAVSAQNSTDGKFLFTGVSESCAEFGSGNLPGTLDTDYTWPSTSAIDTLIETGMNTFRIGFMMERVIPDTLTGSIDETYFAGLEATVNHVTGQGKYAVLDPHNYGRYYGSIIEDVSGFQAWWATMAARFSSNPLVVFDTNNEYHDMDNSLVASLNQAAIDGIRGAGATTQYIFVEGNSWSGAWHWVDSGTGDALVSLADPSDKIVYEMHQYLDSDGSGTSEECVSATIGAERLAAATAWLRENGKRGVIGETAGAVNDVCIEAVVGEMQHLLDNSDVWTGWLWWAGGPWWGDYMFSMEPPSGAAYTGVLPSIQQFIGA